jgi:hypothetical protein
MADISAFPTIHQVLHSGNNILNLTAGAAIKAGQVVGAHGTGVSKEVIPNVGATPAVGAALYDAAEGAPIAVAGPGCIVNLANEDASTAIDAGTWVSAANCAVGGTVVTIVAADEVVGITIDDIPGGGYAKVLLAPSPNITP